jgi:hypothetical protein
MRTTRKGTRLVQHRLAGAIAGCVLLSCVVAGCTSVRSSLGTSDSSCYRALPTARHAVHEQGRMLGVQLLTLATLRRQAPRLFENLTTTHADSQRVCVVAFEGQFTKSSVSKPSGRSAGRVAVVVSTAPSNQLLGTVIFTRAPLRFGHSHFG